MKPLKYIELLYVVFKFVTEVVTLIKNDQVWQAKGIDN